MFLFRMQGRASLLCGVGFSGSLCQGREVHVWTLQAIVRAMLNPWWRHQTEIFSRNWSPGNSPHKGQWRGALMFSLICVWINDWVNNREAGNLRRYRDHYDVIVMLRNAQEIKNWYCVLLLHLCFRSYTGFNWHYVSVTSRLPGPPLLTWFNFNPDMHK